ncbi:MAG: transcription-repair coupling factor [Anaerolineales bacterium]|nr:transcription-repair coupling factor [Anaerolineales bacterium]
MELLLTSLRSTPEYQILLESLRGGDKSLPALGLARAARLPTLAALHSDLNQPIVLITDRADHATALHDELAFWLPGVKRYLFAEPNPLFYEQAAWGVNTRRERLDALTALAAYHLPGAEKPVRAPIIVSSVRALMTRSLPRRDFLKACKTLKLNGSYQTEMLIRAWSELGYELAETVTGPGQFSRRGGLLDIWPPALPAPVRLDFFGDELDTIRSFDPATQRTLAKLESALVTPAREYLVKADDSRVENSKIDKSNIEDSNIEYRVSNIEYPVSHTEPSEFQIPLLHPSPATLLDYLPARSLVLADDFSLMETMAAEIEEQAVRFRQESINEGTLPQDFPVPYLSWSELSDAISSKPSLALGFSNADEAPTADSARSLASVFGHDQRFGGRLKPFVEYLLSLKSQGDQVLILSRQAKRLQELWQQAEGWEIPDGQQPGKGQPESEQISFIDGSLSEGFVLRSGAETSQLIHLMTDSEVFGWERPKPRSRQHAQAEAPEAAFADLKVGDFVVHVDYGIGRFSGLVQRALEGHEREFLAVEYDGNSQIFVPVHQADRLTRYVGREGGAPSLSRLGTQEWPHAKQRVREAVQEVAQELLELYAKRQTVGGYAFAPDSAWQKELEDSFPYIETPDQRAALEAIKHDMEAARPMDRLLCGDVGYGKTEVALRAAFKAVQEGRQVAVLVPTTVLAQQHYETFQQRLAAFPVTVEMLSRFRTSREQNEIIRRLLLGQIDILIGTHRLISQDVEFKDLGLVIIDEEQRFGVTHKEHLKKLRTEVDVLTLTATPIPRTLYMALSGVRDISTLNTPPEERLPVITHIGPYSPRLIRQAVLRELERGGQVFFVHNRVQTIHAMKMHLEKLIPEARIGVGHGQLAENQLSNVMHDFTNAKIDILLSTTIIESGLDIPNANTLIVDRADTFGLAQLYQLRGRVGRAASRAYAYFFRHRKKPPTVEGQERLEVIAENTQLGAGYSIAMRDLEIRGAGDLLGVRQSGQIDAVGFHLYTRMLAAEVKRLKVVSLMVNAAPEGAQPSTFNAQLENFNALSTFEQELKEPVTVDLPLAIGIPKSYVSNQDLRLRLYRRLASLRDEGGVEALAAEFSDRFGPLPEMVQNLFFQMKVKLRADSAGLLSVNTENGQIALRYPVLSENMAQRMLSDLGRNVRGGKNAYWCTFLKEPDWQERLLEVLDRLNKRVIDAQHFVIDGKLLPG